MRPGGHGRAWDQLEACQAQIAGQVKAGPVGGQDRGAAGAAGRRGALPDAAPVLRGAVRVREDRGDGPGRRRRARDGVPDRLRLPGPARGPGERAAAEGARADLHRVLFAAHVRVAELHPDPRRVRRRVRGGVGVLRRGVQGPGPRQRLRDRRGRRRGEPAVHRGLAGLRPALRVRHRRGPGPLAEGQAAGGAGRAVRARELLRRRGLHRPGRCAGPRAGVVPRRGRDADPRHDRRAPRRGVRRARGGRAAAAVPAL